MEIQASALGVPVGYYYWVLIQVFDVFLQIRLWAHFLSLLFCIRIFRDGSEVEKSSDCQNFEEKGIKF